MNFCTLCHSLFSAYKVCQIERSMHAPSYSVKHIPVTSAFITSTQHLQLPDVTSTATRCIYPTPPTTRCHKHRHASQGCPEQQMIPLKQPVQLRSTLYLSSYLSSARHTYICHKEFVKIKSQNPHAWGSYEIILLYVQQEIAHITVYCYGKHLLKINHDYIQNQSFCV